MILLFKKGELALNDRYRAASDLISLIAVKSLSKSSIPIFIWTLEVAIDVPYQNFLLWMTNLIISFESILYK